MMAEQKDIFDIMLDERELRRNGFDLIPTYDNGFVTIKEKTFVDNFEQQIQTGVQELFKRFKLNEQTKEDIAKGGEVLEGVGKGLFAGAITNPLALIVNEDSKFMQDARQAVEFNPDFDIANMGYEASKFFGAFLGLGKLMGIGKAAIQFNKLGTVGKEAVRGLGSVFAGYEGSDENLVDAFMSMGANPEEYPVLRRLMTDPDDSDLEGRLKNVLADLPIEAIAPSIILTTKIFKKYRKAKKDNAPNFQATEKEFENALDDLKKQSNELLDQYSVGAALNPEGDLAKSIIEEADVNTSVSKLAPNKGEVVNLKPKVDRLNFYSKAEEVTNQLKQNKGTGQQYRQQLLKAGVKPDEIEWLGLDDVLNKGKITKQEIQDQINANRIELDEVELSGSADDVLGGLASRFNENETVISAEDAFGPEYLNERADEIFEQGPLDKSRTDFTREKAMQMVKEEYDENPVMKYVDPRTGYTITGNDDVGYSIFREEADSSNFRNAIDYRERNASGSRGVSYSLNEAVIRAREDIMEGDTFYMPGEGTRFGEYTEPGGDNYREFLIKYNNPEVQFDESHFDELNVIAHFRTKDRTTSDGKKVFYIEEIQSDWGQQGRDKGFLLSKKELADIDLKLADAKLKYKDLLNTFTIKQGNKQIPFTDWYVSRRKELATSEYDKKQLENIDLTSSMRDEFKNQVSANFIFKNGKQVNGLRDIKFMKEVNDLQEQINFYQNLPNMRNIPKAPFITDTDKWTQLTLKRILSKAVDEGYDFVSLTPGKSQMDRWRNEGVAKFYDEIVPKNAEKIVKKLDKNAIQKDKQVKIPNTMIKPGVMFDFPERFSIELTQQLKEKVKKGMAMFSATPLVVGQENE